MFPSNLPLAKGLSNSCRNTAYQARLEKEKEIKLQAEAAKVEEEEKVEKKAS